MNWYYRLGFFCVITGLLFVGWWPIAFFYALWLWYQTLIPYELLLVGFLIDGYFGTALGHYWYTFIALLFCLTAIYFKPLLYTQFFQRSKLIK